ncbi:MAG: outer membrane protein assembly factor BamE (lipoprotein component of BamABCDE complex) [Paracoccaceae bacterium]|jgi:outer membrane protein assembly factor BamE (lipoprotein component of BamABCDE complex)
MPVRIGKLAGARSGLRRGAVAAALLAVAAGCAPIVSNHGYAPPEDRLALIEAGIDSPETVSRKIGRPSTAGVIRADAWYYVASTFQTVAWNAPEPVSRRVVAVRFGPDGLVSKVDRYGLEDGVVIDLATRTTPTYGREMTIIQQVFGNIGNVRASEGTTGGGGIFGQ